MSDWLNDLPAEERDLVSRREQPEWIAPMLARLTRKRFSDENWLFERKFDGERMLAFRDGDRRRLLTRNAKEINDTYPELADAFAAQTAGDFIVDGEIVAFEGAVTSFSRLQQRMQIRDPKQARASGVEVFCYVFDILHLDGRDVCQLPLRSRKALLKQLLDFDDPLRFSIHRNEDGEAYFREACEKGWEGLVAKRADAPYRHGRSSDWLKFKCARGQELVIGGFTPPGGSRKGFGALLVGYYEGDRLRYAGKVGTGYDDDTLVRLRRCFDGMTRQHSPFADAVDEPSAVWVDPDLVGAFAFTEWTNAGRLRHPRFLGLRRDKAAMDVTHEADGG